MTSEILAALLRSNIVAAVAIFLVLVVRAPLRRMLGARAVYALWLAVPLAAAASFLPAHSLPLPGPITIPFDFGLAATGAPAEAAPSPDSFNPSLALLALWLFGAVAGLVVTAWRHNRFLRALGRLVSRGDGSALAEIGAGPAVLGVFRPRIIVPKDFDTRFDATERAVILAHETVHLRGGDAQINALLILSQCLCWFNPLVHIAAFHVRLDQELACDAAVMARYPEARRSYAEALLKTQLASAPLPLGCYWPARSAHPLKERLAMLKLTPPGRLRRLAGASLVTLIALGSAYAAWAAKPATIEAPVPAEMAIAAPAALPLQPPAPAQAKDAPPRGVEPPVPAPAAEDVCLSNACAAASAAPVGSLAAPAGATAGPLNAPVGSFNARFNASAPLLIKGRVSEVRTDGPNVEVILSQDGKTFRVVGGPATSYPPELLDALKNAEIVVRGYQSWDTSCTDGCEMNGRDLTFLDGRKVFVGQAGTGAPRDGTDATER